MDQHITIPNPDDELDSMPIFDGPAAEALKTLKPGTYITDTGDKFTVGRGVVDDAEIPADLALAAARYWFGDQGQVQHGATKTRHDPFDGGSYTLTGARISGGSESAIIYRLPDGRRDGAEFAIEFYDGSCSWISRNSDGTYHVRHMNGDTKILAPAGGEPSPLPTPRNGAPA